jgi:hypothetical protein
MKIQRSNLSTYYYLGRFEFPIGSGNWFEGKHDPLVTKAIYDKVQETMKTAPHAPYGSKEFAFTRLMKCGECGAGITAEEKLKRLKSGEMVRYVYYGCMGRWARKCSQLYIREEELTKQLCRMIDDIEIDRLAASRAVQAEIDKVRKVAVMIGGKGVINKLTKAAEGFDLRTYAKYILKEGTREEKRGVLEKIKSTFVLRDGHIFMG